MVKNCNYITVTEFNDFGKNQDTLIKILNHNMTKLSVDVCWLKKLMGWQVGLMTTVAVAILVAFIKVVFS